MLNFNDLYPSEFVNNDETAFIVGAVIDEYQRIMTNIFNRMRSVEELEALYSGPNIKISPWVCHEAANKELSSKPYRHPILGLLKEDRLARRHVGSRVRHQRQQSGRILHKWKK